MRREKMWLPFIIVLLCSDIVRAQELFVFTEPASNMPAHSVGIRATNQLLAGNDQRNYFLAPEIMWGVNKRLMLHAEGYISDMNGPLALQGFGGYAKYRFYSSDKLYHHFRMAAFGRISSVRDEGKQEELQTNGFNSGFQAGLIGTQLLHKTALSVTGYYEQAFNRANDEFSALPGHAFNYSLSAGRLLYPKRYKGYRQTNINLMAELLGQYLPANGHSYIDIGPSLQFMFNSQTRLDIGYRAQLFGNVQRLNNQGVLLRVEHLLYKI